MKTMLLFVVVACSAASTLATTVSQGRLMNSGSRIPTGWEDRMAKARQYPYLGIRQEPWTPHHSLGFFEHGLDHEMQFHDDVWVAWTADEEENLFTCEVAVATSGWIGFGPTDSGSMIGGNPSVVREEPVGSGNFQCFAMHSDHMYNAFTTPLMNADQNCELISVSQVGNETRVRFTRPMIGCRPDDVDIRTSTDMRFFAAWGDSQVFSYHGVAQRATREFHVTDGVYEPQPLPPNTTTYEMRMVPMVLPGYRDIYLCRGFRYPQDQRYHIVRTDPILYDIYPAAYHHLLVFACPNGMPDEYADPSSYQACPVVPHPSCFTYQLGWALGGQSLHFDKFGVPIGAGPGAAKDVLLQTHVDNPYGNTDLWDIGWGFRHFYTSTLREIEGGSFGFYSGTPLVGIPPGEEDFPSMSECNDDTTLRAFPHGMWIDSVFTHMHYTGKSSRVSHIREVSRDEWVELPYLWDMDHYDSNWQGSRGLREPGVRVEPGDRLRQHCTWNTTQKTQPTRNGEGYEDEMCISYIIYYPIYPEEVHPISICAEFPPGIGITFSDVGRNGQNGLSFSRISRYDYEPFVPEPDTCFSQ